MKVCIIILTHLIQYIMLIHLHNSEPGIYVWVSYQLLFTFPEFNGLVSRIVNLTKANMDALQLEDSTWVTQMKNAMNVNGGDIENATFIDYLLHFLTFFWKVGLLNSYACKWVILP